MSGENCTQAQELKPVADRTLLNENSVVTPVNGQVDRIDGGAIRGANLFHSFSQFSIGEGREVYFANPSGIQNILGRVTGSNASQIFGKLGVLGNANLFLINPNGIIFGPNASLDIRGSFLASTASSLKFADGTKFSATAPDTAPLLTISVPLGLQLGTNSGAIAQAGNLAVGQGQNLTLVGGTVAVTGNISAPGGQISVVSVPKDASVNLNSAGQFLGISSTPSGESTKGTALSLPELLKTTEPNTGLKVNSRGQVELTRTGVEVPTDPGTTLILGNLDTSNLVSEQIGGLVRVLGDKVGLFDSTRINVSGDFGGGKVFIDNSQSQNGEITSRIFVDNNVSINADAVTKGNGGTVNVSGDINRFYGKMSARGGLISGNGGVSEISGKNSLVYEGSSDTSAPSGLVGELKLGLANLTIVDVARNTSLAQNAFSDPDTASNTLSWRTISANMRDLNNVVLEATGDVAIADIASPGFIFYNQTLNDRPLKLSIISQSGGIKFADPNDRIFTGGRDISLQAQGDIVTGSIYTGRNGRLSRGYLAGDISLKSGSGTINTSAGELNTGTPTDDKDFLAGAVKLEARGNIVTGNISTISSVADSNDITLISEAGGIDTSAGTLDARGNKLTSEQIGNGGSVSLDAYGKIKTASIDTSGNTSGNVNLTSRNDSIDTTAGNIKAFSFTGNVGDVTLTALGDITTGSISTKFTNYVENNLDNALDSGLMLDSAISNSTEGNISIRGRTFTLANNAKLDASTEGNGNSGTVSIRTTDGVTLGDGSQIITTVAETAEGNGGDINISTDGKLLLGSGAQLSTSTLDFGIGNAGNVSITAKDGITIKDGGWISTLVAEDAIGNGGDIGINTGSHLVLENTALTTSLSGIGNAGDVFITAKDVDIKNSQITTRVESGAVGNGGSININANGLIAVNNSELSTSSLGRGKAGNVSINAKDNITIATSKITTTLEQDGFRQSGDIELMTNGQLSITEGTLLSTSSLGRGSAGKVRINAKGDVTIASSFVSTTLMGEKAAGDGGNISINTDGQFLMANSAQLSTSSSGKGSAGLVTITANNDVSIADRSGISTTVGEEAVGDSGDININTEGQFSVTNEAQLSTTSSGEGNAGNVSINAKGDVAIAHSRISTTLGEKATGNGGNIKINTGGGLLIVDDSRLSTSSSGTGDAGKVSISVEGDTTIANSQISTKLDNGAQGKGGDIDLTTNGRLSITDGSELTTSTSGIGDAGDINIKAQKIHIGTALADSTLRTLLGAETSGQGKGGDISLTTDMLQIFNGGQVLTTTSRNYQAGNITVNSAQKVTISGKNTGLFANTAENSTGQGGDLRINTPQLFVENGAQISASTAGTGHGGTLTINAPQSVRLTGANSRLSAESYSTGDAGSLTMRTGKLQVQDGAEITVSAPFALAGDLKVFADSIFLDRGKLTAINGAVNREGGNITLSDFRFLQMGKNSLISAEARNNANGGNVIIDAKNGFIFAIAKDNSDIVAKAELGRGGNIIIKANGIYGFDLKSNANRSDIDASSGAGPQFNGKIEIFTLNIDPNKGTIELPTVPTDTKVSQGCNSPDFEQNEFVIAGRGGLPTNPRDILSSDAVQVNWVARKQNGDNRFIAEAINKPKTTNTQPIVEAVGWIVNAKGEIILTANPPTATAHSSWQNPTECQYNSDS